MDVIHVLARSDSVKVEQSKVNRFTANPPAGLQPAFRGFFERLEQRVLLDGNPSIIDDLTPDAGNNATYVLDLAAGKSQTTPPANTPRPPTSSPTGAGTGGAAPTSGAPGDTPSSTQPSFLTGTGNSEPPARSPSDFRYVLRPGSGFAGASEPDPTIQTQNQSEAGWDEKAIARWDVVPYQTFDDVFNVGVVAFHMNGIKQVDFSVNGGDWTAVKTMTKNPQTDVYEYTATLRAADFADGQVEIRAIAYPQNGVARVLQGSTIAANGENSMFLSTNAGHTLPSIAKYVSTTGSDTTGDGSPNNPYASIMMAAHAIQIANGTGNADGGTIYLLAGNYQLGTYSYGLLTTTADRWLTITHAPGLSQSDVTITGTAHNSGGTSGIRTKLVRLFDLTATAGIVSTDPPSYLWCDAVDFAGPGRTVPMGDWAGGWDASFFTGCHVHDCQNGPQGDLVRNCSVDNIGGIAYSGSGLVVNSTASNINAAGTQLHPDVYQYYGNSGNVILYGLTAITNLLSQGLFCGDNIGLTDAAIVACSIDNTASGVGRTFSFGGATQNLYVSDCSFVGPNCSWAVPPDQHFTAVDVVVESCSFNGASQLGAIAGVTYR